MNRKKFIQTSLGMAGAGMVSPSLFASGPEITGKNIMNRTEIKKSLKFGMVQEDISIEEKFRMLKDLGFDGVEMDSPNELNNRDIITARDRTGLEIPGVVNSVHWKSPLSDPDEQVRRACFDSMITALDDCKEYGGTTVLLVPGVVNADVSYEDAYLRSQQEIRKLIPHAEETGVKIAIENVWNNFLISRREAARYLDEINSPVVGWYFDVGNIVRYGWPEHWIRTLNRRILKLDVKEYSREKQRNEGISKGFDVELMEGDCNWPVVNKSLEEIGYNGWASAEVPGGNRKRIEQISMLMDKIFKS
ncbi:MAG: sugar phosphate isomerase/epimerase [Cyclobacteriaceae bacterium]|nr:sugar phosphate isomerase/epimerase [Cyclobacteriaceae bacterium]